jgi:hypothetical protein
MRKISIGFLVSYRKIGSVWECPGEKKAALNEGELYQKASIISIPKLPAKVSGE